jgi:hypothetical protein
MARAVVSIGPALAEMPPGKDFSKLPPGVRLEDAWQVVGPSVEKNMGRAPLWRVIAMAYVEGLMHGAGIAQSKEQAP